MATSSLKPVNILYSYAREDKAFRDKLDSVLRRTDQITSWTNLELSPGTEWQKEIVDYHLNTAHIILLLISANFMVSDFCHSIEIEQAIERHKAGTARVIPIILRPADWHDAPFARLQALPKDAKPVTTWAHLDEAFLNIAQGIRRAVSEFLATSKTQEQWLDEGNTFITLKPYNVELVQQFLTKAGFDFQTVPHEVGFIATAKNRVWRTRFPKGLYIHLHLDHPLDQQTVKAISQDSKKHSDHALVVINKPPNIDGWIAINTLRNQEGRNRFVCLPIDEALIQEGIALNQEQQTLRLYINERLGKEFDPYDVRDPVSGAVSFFGRQRLTEEILDALRRGQRLGLFGIHKMGKSSVLYELQKKAEFPVAYVYLNTDDDLADIYTRIVEDWALNGRVKYPDFKWTKPPLSSQTTKVDFSIAVKSLLAYLGTIADTPPLLGIFLDEIEHIVPYEGDERTFKLYVDLMDTLRGLQQETTSVALLVAGVHPSIARRNLLWGNQKNPMHQIIVENFLPPLDEEDCSYMIRSLGQQINLRYEENALKHILHMSGSHPFLARLICSRAYRKRRDMNAISAQMIEEVAQDFIRDPATASYFDEHGLWGELGQPNLWGQEIGKANHAILRTLASSLQDLSEDESYTGLDKKVAIHAFHALKERGIIHSPDNAGHYCIAFGLFRDWIRFHQLDSEKWNM